MKQYITPVDIANTVRMMRPLFTGVVIIVEGDSDARAYRRFIDEAACRIVPAQGKSNALIAMGMLEKGMVAGVFAIVDADFTRLDGRDERGPNILVTDTHDLETMIIKSPALDTVLVEFGNQRSLDGLGAPVREILVRAAMPLGYLRWLSSSSQENLSLRFKNLSYAAFIVTANHTLRTDVDAMLHEVQSRTSTIRLEHKKLRARIAARMNDGADDPWQVSRGHDLVHILAEGLRGVFGNRNARTISHDQIDRILRIAFSNAEFKQTHLYQAMKEWGETNNRKVVV